MNKGAELGGWRLAGFSGAQIPLAALGLPLAVYLPEYYANDLGVPLAAVGLAFLLVRLCDIAVDPIVGALMDRTHGRFGRFRPWLAAGAPLLMLGSYLLFMARPGVDVAYLTAALVVVYLGFSIVVVGHFAWASTLSATYDGRSRVFAWLQGLVLVGVLLALGLPAALALLARASAAAGMHAMGWLVIGLTPLSLALAFLSAGERPEARAPTHAGLSDYVALLKNRTVLRLLGLDLSWQAATQVSAVLFFFYFEQVKHFSKGQAGLLLLAYFLGGLAGAALWLRLATRWGKHRAMAIAAGGYAVSQTVVLLTPAGDMAIGAVLMAIAGAPFSAAGVLVRAMLADLGDEERLTRGADRLSLFYALQIGDTKLAAAAALVTFPLLALIGFKAGGGAVNGAGALIGLRLMFVIIPAGLALLSAWLAFGYPLTAERHAQVRAQLNQRDALLLAEAESALVPMLAVPLIEAFHDPPAPP
jgi:GPH family glycoside/pentoside/hexuronide:cation symporter